MKQLSKMGLRLILLFVMVLAHIPAFAEPIISSVSGVFTHGSTVTITGSSFGTHGDYHPDQDKLIRIWETFETGNFVSNPYQRWKIFNPPALEIIDNSPTKRASQENNYLYRRNNTGLGNIFISGQDHEEYWVSHWIRISDSFNVCQGGSRQWKLTRFWSTQGSGKVNLYPSYGCSVGYNMGIEFTSPQILAHQTRFLKGSPPLTGWHRWDIYIKKSTTAISNDGTLQIVVDNELVYDFKRDTGDSYHGGMNFDSQNGDFASAIDIGSYFSGASSETYIDYDDIYISHTRARVEICNSSNFSTSNQCEVQTPLSWSDTSITITVNAGALSLSEACVYVVDGNGNTSDCGKPSPKPPSNLTVQ